MDICNLVAKLRMGSHNTLQQAIAVLPVSTGTSARYIALFADKEHYNYRLGGYN